MTRYRKANPNEIRQGALVWVDAERMNLAGDDERVNDGRTAVRVLDIDAGAVVVSGMPPTFGARAPVVAVPAEQVWVQLDNPGDPLLPGAIQEHPDKAPTQMVYPPGIDMATVGTPGGPPVPRRGRRRRGRNTVLARPAVMHADDSTWQLECPTCPLATDGPPMICAAGTRVPGGGFMMGMHCPHNAGLRLDDITGKISTGCSYSCIEQGARP